VKTLNFHALFLSNDDWALGDLSHLISVRIEVLPRRDLLICSLELFRSFGLLIDEG
jgi:hypothetical protein